jgi:hypothetical protein
VKPELREQDVARLETRNVVEQFPPSVELVVWVNEFFGPIVTEAGEGFERTPLYQQNRARILNLVA